MRPIKNPQRLHNSAEMKSIRRRASAVAGFTTALSNDALSMDEKQRILTELQSEAAEINRSARRLRFALRREQIA